MEEEKVLVSICCQTYMHVDYIKQALDSFLMQKVDFNYEILLRDDASNDGTAEICQEYAKRYPDKVKFLSYTENQYQKGVSPFQDNVKRAQGKYIAMCEGDDYWTDPLKLQKQVDFLESHPEYSICVSGFENYNVYTKKTESIIIIPSGVMKNSNGYTFTLDDTKKKWLTKTLTAVYRKDKDIFNKMNIYKYGRDVNLFYHILKRGKGFYYTQVMGVYQTHQGGIHSMQPRAITIHNAYLVYKELYEVNRDDFSRYKYVIASLKLFNFSLYNKEESLNIRRYEIIGTAVTLIKSFDEFMYFLISFFHETVLSIKNLFHNNRK